MSQFKESYLLFGERFDYFFVERHDLSIGDEFIWFLEISKIKYHKIFEISLKSFA